jgi:hypothetical protein
MPTSRSSSSLNTRVFSPTVVLQQDTRRLEIRLRASDGYTIDSGITFGDCIYYDPVGNQYLQSRALDSTAEVLGVVESIDSGEYTVVTYGSIKYPQTRLDKITEGDVNGIDVLFLDYDPTNIGGLTGQVKIPTGSDSAIVKPVLQLAPHVGGYNAVVLNYLGYKIGNSAAASAAPENMGGIITIPDGSDPGPGYVKLDTINTLYTSEYPFLFEVFGTANGPYIMELTMSTAASITSALVGKTVTQAGAVIGTVSSVQSNKVYIERTDNLRTPTNGYCYINSLTFNVTSTNVIQFSLPTKESYLIGDTKYDYWMNIEPLTKITIPQELNATDITVENLSVGSYTNIEDTLNSLQQQINEIKSRIGM